jgi:hypothetical protein
MKWRIRGAPARGARSFHYPAMLPCLLDGRRPEAEQIEAVAIRIWNDCRGSSCAPWRSLAEGSTERRRMRRAALIALGE